MLLVGQQEGHPARKKYGGDGVGGHGLVRMEWRPAGWSVCLPLLIFPCVIKSRGSLLAPDHPGGPRERAVKRLWCGDGGLGVERAPLDCKSNAQHAVLQNRPTVQSEPFASEFHGRLVRL